MPPLHRLAPPPQAFVQPVQAPDVPRMLAGARQRVVQPQIGAIDRLGLVNRPASISSAPSAWRVGCIQPQGSS